MRWLILFVPALIIFSASAAAQHTVAPNGYYPGGYSGDVWTGEVTDVNDANGEITLKSIKGNKVESFVGVAEEGYIVSPKNGPERPLKISDIKVGRVLTVYYFVETRKVDGKKITFHTIFHIDSIPNARKRQTYFTAFNAR